MRRKALLLAIMLLLLLCLMTSTFRFEPVLAVGIIYIHADGSIEPPTAPISTLDSVTYTVHESINGSIEIDRNNVVFDGAGKTLEGPATSDLGISLQGRTNVTIKNIIVAGFTTGIKLDSCSSITIIGTTMTKDSYGIHLTGSSQNIISGNNASNNSDYGIWLSSSGSNSITANTIKNNNYDGILIADSNSNNIFGNILTSNNDGIRLESSTGNTVSANKVADSNGYDMWNTTNNGYAIVLISSSQNMVSGNIASNSVKDGIRLESSANNTVSGNNIKNNNEGLGLSSSSNNNVFANNVTNNIDCGFRFESSSNDNRLHGNNITSNGYGVWFGSSTNNAVFQNNFLANSVQAQTAGNNEMWVDSSGTHGNYWSDYSTKYPNATEVGTSGIENATYIIDSNNQDNNPLVNQTIAENTVPELSSSLVLLLMIATTVPLIIYKRRHYKQ
jgi:parallel beta-helix repeat protein